MLSVIRPKKPSLNRLAAVEHPRHDMKADMIHRLLRRMALLPALLGVSCMNLNSTLLPLPSGLKREAGLRYTPDHWPKPLLADVYHRPGGPPAPAVLLIHGGSWAENGSRWTMTPIAKALVRRGYLVVNVSYRGTPSDRYPAPIEDLREAIRWMRSHAARYGIDGDRIATYGFSAGAHLAAQVALQDGNPSQVRAIVAASGPFNLSLDPGGEAVRGFLGGTRNQIPDRFREASPVNHVTRSSPPIFLYHGTRDRLVPPEHASQMAAAYRKQGFDTTVHWLEGRKHAGVLLFPGKAVEEAIDFLDIRLKR